MSTARQAFVFLAFLRYVWGHGAVSRPSGRIFPPNVNCPWCMGEHKPGSNPYGTVNRGERLSSPCMGSSRGDSTRSNWGPYANVAGEFDKPTYSAGQTFDANVVLDADHGGDAQWQICPHSQGETEECFTQNRLTDWKDVHCPFGRCDAGPHAFDRQSYTDYVKIPDNFPSGGATLRWLWVCKWTDEVFTSCIDVDIAGNSGTSGNNAGSSSSSSSSNTGSTSSSSCATTSDDCTASKCCIDPGMMCYEKNQYWASCKETCQPGIDFTEPEEYQQPWSCTEFGSRTPVTTDDGQDSGSSQGDDDSAGSDDALVSSAFSHHQIVGFIATLLCLLKNASV